MSDGSDSELSAVEEGDVQQSMREEFDDETADAALDLLRLFTRARLSVSDARLVQQNAEADTRQFLADMRHRLAEAIVDDCLLFDESAVFAQFDFLSAWTGVADKHDPDQHAAVDAALERSYRRAVEVLSAHLVPSVLGDSGAMRGGPTPA